MHMKVSTDAGCGLPATYRRYAVENETLPENEFAACHRHSRGPLDNIWIYR